MLTSSDAPGGCWFFWAVLVGLTPDDLRAGDTYEFAFEEVEQDGYRYRATAVGPHGHLDATPPSPTDVSGRSYRSELHLRFD